MQAKSLTRSSPLTNIASDFWQFKSHSGFSRWMSVWIVGMVVIKAMMTPVSMAPAADLHSSHSGVAQAVSDHFRVDVLLVFPGRELSVPNKNASCMCWTRGDGTVLVDVYNLHAQPDVDCYLAFEDPPSNQFTCGPGPFRPVHVS